MFLKSRSSGGFSSDGREDKWKLSNGMDFAISVPQGNIAGNQGTKLDLETPKGCSVAGEMTRQARALTSKSDILPSIPGTHSERRGETPEPCVLTSTHVCVHRH